MMDAFCKYEAPNGIDFETETEIDFSIHTKGGC